MRWLEVQQEIGTACRKCTVGGGLEHAGVSGDGAVEILCVFRLVLNDRGLVHNHLLVSPPPHES